MNPRKHKLFEQYPLGKTVQISVGKVPTPYHVYSGYGAFVGGVANINSVRGLIKDEYVVPVQTVDGDALVGIWMLDFTDASLGPHHELQISIFVGREEVTDLSSHSFGLLEAMLTRKEVKMLCHGLWNNTERVVAYNRELLSLNARAMKSSIEKQDNKFVCEFLDKTDGQCIITGEFQRFGKASMQANIQMIKQIGLMRMLRLVQQPWVSMQILNPRGVRLAHNATAHAYTKNKKDTITLFDYQKSVLTIDDPKYADLGFRPQFVQYMEGFKFVYLAPAFSLAPLDGW